MNKCIRKFDNMALLNLLSLTDEPICFFFPVISSVLLYSYRKPRACQRLGNSPGVGKCPALGSAKFANTRSPGLKRWANALQWPGGGGGGTGHSWNWHSISNNDGEGYESVTKKVNSRRVKKRNASNFRKRKRKFLSYVPVLDKTWI